MNERERKREWKKERTDEGDKKARVRGRGEKWGREGERKERFLLVAPPRIQSHRVYSSVHLILFIGFKAFAGTPYLRI